MTLTHDWWLMDIGSGYPEESLPRLVGSQSNPLSFSRSLHRFKLKMQISAGFQYHHIDKIQAKTCIKCSPNELQWMVQGGRRSTSGRWESKPALRRISIPGWWLMTDDSPLARLVTDPSVTVLTADPSNGRKNPRQGFFFSALLIFKNATIVSKRRSWDDTLDHSWPLLITFDHVITRPDHFDNSWPLLFDHDRQYSFHSNEKLTLEWFQPLNMSHLFETQWIHLRHQYWGLGWRSFDIFQPRVGQTKRKAERVNLLSASIIEGQWTTVRDRLGGVEMCC